MRQEVILAMLAMISLVGCAEARQSTSPSLRAGHPTRSTSPASAFLPADLQITPPAADLPAAKAAWSGIWSGWACRERACDTKLAVEKITAEGATIVYSFASRTVPPFVERTSARFVGHTLQAGLSGGARIMYRVRPDGALDFLWTNDQDWSTGILSREQ